MSLDTRINSALRSGARIKDVEQVIIAVDAEIDATQSKHDVEVARSIDPALTTPEAREARNNAADLEHDIRRLNASRGLLKEKLDKLIADAQAAEHRARYDAAKAERDALAKHIRTRYPALAMELVDLVGRIAASDAECAKFRLDSAEYKARESGWQWPLTSGGGPMMRFSQISLPLLGREGMYLPKQQSGIAGTFDHWRKLVDEDQALAKRPVPDLDDGQAKAA